MSTHNFPIPAHGCAEDPTPRLRAARRFEILTVWAERAQRRAQLRRDLIQVAKMPEYLLKDIGIAREDAYCQNREARKPFWRA